MPIIHGILDILSVKRERARTMGRNDIAGHEIKTLFKSQSLVIDEYECDGGPASDSTEETSDAHNMVILLHGAFVRYDPRGRLLADANQALFFNRGEPYAVSHPVAGGDTCTILTFADAVLMSMLRPLDPEFDDRDDVPFPFGHTLIDGRQRIYGYHGLRRALSAVAQDALEIEERATLLLGNVARSAYLNLARHRKRPPPAPSETSADVVHQAMVEMARGLRDPLHLGALAAAAHCSPYYLCRAFKAEIGLSVHRYLRRLRLLSAVERLSQSPETRLADVALEFGFSSHSHFSTAFRQECALSPAEFRGLYPIEGKGMGRRS